MNNELFNHQKSDAVKWVCTLLAFLIVGVLIAGIICGWFDKKETPPVENELAQETVNLQSVKLAMSATATVAADNSISKTITAKIFSAYPAQIGAQGRRGLQIKIFQGE